MTRPDSSALLVARLDLHPDPVNLEVEAGHARHVDDDATVDALVGRDARRRHRVWIDGRRAGHGIAGRVRRGMGVVSGAPVAAEVSVLDHLVAVCGRHRAEQVLGGSPLLAHRGGDPAGVLSGGERRILAWLLVDALDPAVVVLDRATEGLDADALAWARGRVAAWLRRDRAVVIRPGRAEERAFPGGH